MLPETKVDEKVMIVPGTDGQKMSKSYNNVIDIFHSEKKLRKQIMSIKTDSLEVKSPKNPETCNVFKLYSLLATENEALCLKQKYIEGNYGYGEAKKELFQLICDKYKAEKEKFNYLMENKSVLDAEFIKGAKKARRIARDVLTRVRKKIGY